MSSQDTHSVIKRRIWLGAVWSWPVGAVIFGVSFVLIARFVPPVPPSWSAQQVADFYAAHTTSIRIGLLGAMFGSAFLLPFYAVVSAEIRKIEGKDALLAPIQFGGAIVLVTFFQIIGLLWLLASFRPEINPELVRTLNDYGWFVWSMLIPTYIIQFVAMAIAGFMDSRPDPIWPRWAAYLNLWVAVTGAGGVLAVFFKTGPFAWNGLVGFWIPLILFAIGMTVTTALFHRRATREVSVERATQSASDPLGTDAANAIA
jgi:hypothetical protein